MAGSTMTLVGWVGTYLVHSTVLLGAVWLVLHCGAFQDRSRETLWRLALFGGFVTASLQLQLGLGPVLGRLELAVAPATSPAVDVEMPAAMAGAEFPVVEHREHGDLGHGGVLSDFGESAAERVPVADIEWLSLALPVFLWLWVAGVVVVALRQAGRRLRLQWLLADRRPVPPGRLQRRFGELRRRAGLGPGTRLTTSTRTRCPLAFGVLRPEVCLPRAMVDTMDLDQQGCVLAHELAHLRARDPVWLLLQAAASAVGFLQPLNRLATRQLHELAEYRCDAWAVRHGGSDVHMAHALMTVAESYVAPGEPIPAYAGVNAMAVRGSALSRRVERIFGSRVDGPGRVGRGAVIGMVALSLSAVAVAVPGLSISAPSAPSAPKATALVNEPADPADPADARDPNDPRLDRLRWLAAELRGLQSELDGVRDALAGSLQAPAVRSMLVKLQTRIRQLQAEHRALWQEAVDAAGSGPSTEHKTNRSRR
ncbi:MAG: M56 family metallopeptidase [Planctomycetota bacterium]